MTDSLEYTFIDRGLVGVTGPDRAAFLQGLVSQDVDKVSPERAAYATLLTPQGKYLHDFFIVAQGDTLLLDGEGGRAEELAARLRKYKLRAKIALETPPALGVAVVYGAGAAARLGLGDNPGTAHAFAGGIAFVDPRTAALGCRLIGTAAGIADELSRLDIPAGTFDAYDRQRISLAVPDGSRDIVVEKSTLLESNIDRCNGIDWQKGCYIGQELTARTKHRGLMKRTLIAVSLAGDAPAPGTPVTLAGKAVGEIRSVCADRALASIRLDALESGAADAPLRAARATLSPLST